MSKNELSGTVSIIADRQPQSEVGDAARLALALGQLQVKDEDSFRRCTEILKIAAGRIGMVEQEFEADKSTAYKLWKTITDRIKKWTDPYKEIREDAEAKIKHYIRSLEATKAIQEKALEEEASGAKQELLDRAKAARRQGDIKLARDLEEQANSVMEAVVLPSAQPEVEGISDRRPWTAKIENPLELIVAVAEARVPYMQTFSIQGREVTEPLVLINERAVNALAKKLQNSLRLPGVKAVQEISIAVRKTR